MEAPPQQQQRSVNEVTWGFRVLGRVLGTLGGLGMVAFGLYTCITLTAACFLTGIIMSLSLIPFVICPGLATFLGCGLLFISGTFYGVIAIGKKGDAVKQARDQHTTKDTAGLTANYN